jgi:hypothetical protein
MELKCYRGSKKPCPEWIDTEPDNFPTLCTVSADTSNMANDLRPIFGDVGLYFEQDFSIVLLFGMTELKAQIAWKEKGVEKRGPATIVYDLDDDRASIDNLSNIAQGLSLEDDDLKADGWDDVQPAQGPSSFDWSAGPSSLDWSAGPSPFGWGDSTGSNEPRIGGSSIDVWGAAGSSRQLSNNKNNSNNNTNTNNRGKGKKKKQTAKRGGGPQGGGKRGGIH